METGHDAPRHLLIRQRRRKRCIVALPEPWRLPVPGLPRDNITRDCNEVWLLFANERADHVKRVMVERARGLILTQMQVRQLHDLEVVVSVHAQMHSVHSVEVVVGQGHVRGSHH